MENKQDLITLQEAARILQVKENRVYEAVAKELLPATKMTSGVRKYMVSREDVDLYGQIYLSTGKGKNTEPAPEEEEIQQPFQMSHEENTQDKHVTQPLQEERQMSIIPKPQQNDADLLQGVFARVFAFLGDHHLAIGVRSMQEVIEPLRIWEFVTPDYPLQVVATPTKTVVLADDYQRHLEEEGRNLKDRLREAETKLSYLRQKPQSRILTEYEHPLVIWIEPRIEGIFIWSDSFPFSAYGPTEEEALAYYRRALFGYTYWLRTHEKELDPQEYGQFSALRGLLMDDGKEGK